MCASVCKIYLLLCSTYVMLLLNHQNTLSQKLTPSKWNDSVIHMNPPKSVYQSYEESKQKGTPIKTRESTGSIGTRKNMETSCWNKCGELFDLPCSCDIQCLVYKNCCEDFNLQCPEMLAEVETLYSPELLNSQIECIHNGMLAIFSCPNVSSVGTANLSNTWINEHRERMRRLQSALFRKESLTNTEEDSQTGAESEKQGQSILQLLTDIPVSDISSGLLYKTPEIFYCNAGSKSVSAPWSIEIKSNEILEDIQRMQPLTGEKYKVKYIPPAQLPDDSAYRHCIPHAIGTCKNPQDKCEAFLSYVSVSDKEWVVYNNKYCAFCNGHQEETVHNLTIKEGHRTNFDLSVLMKVTTERVEFSVIGDERKAKLVPWKEAQCDLSQKIQQKEKNKMSTCHIDSCSNIYVLHPDGTCKRLDVVSLALSDHGHIPFLESAVTSHNLGMDQEDNNQKLIVGGPLRALSDLIRCALERNFGYELGKTEFPLRIGRDVRLNATMFVIDVQLFLTPGNISFEETKRSLSAISMIAKALLLYNRTWYMTPRTRSVKTMSSSSNANFLKEINTLDGDLQYSDNPFFIEAQNCSEVLNNFTVCVCDWVFFARAPDKDSEKRCPLYCYEHVFCDHELEEIQAFSEATCFTLFRRLVSCGISWRNESFLLVWFLIVSITIT